MTFIQPKAYQNCIVDLRAGLDANNGVLYNYAKDYNPANAAGDAIISGLPAPYVSGNGTDSPYYIRLLGDGSKISIDPSSKLHLGSTVTVEFIFAVEDDLMEKYNDYDVNKEYFHCMKAGSWSLLQNGIQFYASVQSIGTLIGYGSEKSTYANEINQYAITYDNNNLLQYFNRMPVMETHVARDMTYLNEGDGIIIQSFYGKPLRVYGLRVYNKILTTEELTYNYNLIFNTSQTSDLLVSNEITKTLPDNFVGTNWFGPWEDTDLAKILIDNLNSKNQMDIFAKNIKLSGFDVIRFPGGASVTYTHYGKPYSDLCQGVHNFCVNNDLPDCTPKTESSIMFPDAVLDFCKNHNFKVQYQLNIDTYFDSQDNTVKYIKNDNVIEGSRDYGSGTVDWTKMEIASNTAKALVQHIVDSGYSDVIYSFEIGNENYGSCGGCGTYSGSEYARICDLFISKIREISQDFKFTVIANDKYDVPTDPARAYITNPFFTRDLVNSSYFSPYKNDDKIIYSPHHYPMKPYYLSSSQTMTNFDRYCDIILNGSVFDCREVDKYLSELGVTNPNIVVGEFNSINTGTAFFQTWASALGVARFIISAANNSGTLKILHFNLFKTWRGITFDGGSFGTMQYSTNKKDLASLFVRFPVSYVISLLNKYIFRNILNNNSKTQGVESVISSQGNYYSIVIFNGNIDRTIALDLGGLNLNFVQKIVLGEDVPLSFAPLSSADNNDNPATIKTMKTKIDKTPIDINSISLKSNTLTVLLLRKQ
ncbi:MAG: hypothetical protein WCG23_00865 [bacterium]